MAEWKAREYKDRDTRCFKIAYTSRKQAKGAARVTARTRPQANDWTLHAYKCKVCRAWHIGHDRFAEMRHILGPSRQ